MLKFVCSVWLPHLSPNKTSEPPHAASVSALVDASNLEFPQSREKGFSTGSGRIAAPGMPGRPDAALDLHLVSLTSGNWDTPGNWSGNAVPTSGANVAISTTAAATITIQAGDTVSINSLTAGSNDSLSITGGSLTIAATSTIGGNLNLSGGAAPSPPVPI